MTDLSAGAPRQSTPPEHYTLGSDASPALVLELVERYGVVLMPAYLQGERLAAVKGEAERLLDDEKVGVIERDYAVGRSISVYRDKWQPERYPAMAKLMETPLMREVASGYMGANCSFNHHFFVTRETRAGEPITDLHYDRLETLKFFIYMLDTDRSNGAFECVPGSHRMVQEIRDYHLKRGARIFDLPNLKAPEWLGKPVPMEGPAGTMIIFTTDVFHQGGIVSPDRERWVVRAHTRANPLPEYEPRPLLTRQWWRESAFNPLRYLYRISDALTGSTPPYSDAR
jgi:hypothetical protein